MPYILINRIGDEIMKALVICICLLVLSLPSHAGLITLKSSLSCEVTPSEVIARLLLENNGNEAAYNIKVRFKIADKEWLSEVFPKLDVNQKLEIEDLEKYEPGKKGIYPFTAKIHFQDSAGYPFTTVVATLLVYKESADPNIFGKLEDSILSNRGVLKFNMTNMGNDALTLGIHILIPDELSVEPGQKEFILKARSKEKVTFKLNNFSALSGAVYPVWAIVEYESKDIHFTYLCSGNINVKPRANIFKKYWWFSLILIAIMMSLFIWFNLRRKIHSP